LGGDARPHQAALDGQNLSAVFTQISSQRAASATEFQNPSAFADPEWTQQAMPATAEMIFAGPILNVLYEFGREGASVGSIRDRVEQTLFNIRPIGITEFAC